MNIVFGSTKISSEKVISMGWGDGWEGREEADGREGGNRLVEGQEGQRGGTATERGGESRNLSSEALDALIQRAISAKSSKELQQKDQLLTALQSVTDALWAIESRVSNLERQNDKILRRGASGSETATPGSLSSPPRRHRASASPDMAYSRSSVTPQREKYRSLSATAPVQVFLLRSSFHGTVTSDC